MNFSYADPVIAVFVAIPVLLLVAFVCGTSMAFRRSGASRQTARRVSLAVGAAAAAWMAVTWAAAEAGLLRNWNQNPPPFGLLVGAILLLSATISFSGLGRRLAQFVPLWTLVAIQGFRLPLELAMHAMYERGIMPREMSYSGRNFDVVTGITAIIVAAVVATRRSGSHKLVAIWNVVGLALLLNVVIVAILATPRFRYFGDERLNVWVMYPPFVWLPAVMVLAALTGHLVIFRALRLQRNQSTRIRR